MEFSHLKKNEKNNQYERTIVPSMLYLWLKWRFVGWGLPSSQCLLFCVWLMVKPRLRFLTLSYTVEADLKFPFTIFPCLYQNETNLKSKSDLFKAIYHLYCMVYKKKKKSPEKYKKDVLALTHPVFGR